MFKEWFEFNSFYLDIIMGVRLGKIKTNWLGVRCLTLEDDWNFKFGQTAEIDKDYLVKMV